MSETLRAVRFAAREQAELLEVGPVPAPGPHEVVGRTLHSLVSPGTELNGAYLGSHFPAGSGYAAVFQVTAVGDQVTDLRLGQPVFCLGGHQSHQCQRRENVVPLPDGLAPAAAPFARFLGISMTTLATTAARAPEPMLVTGLGLVGNMATQVFRLAGYRVGGVDPDPRRRALATVGGCVELFEAVPVGLAGWQDRVGLVLDCSGHEAPIIEGARIVRKRGEVVLLGTPWQRRTERLCHELTWEIFHRYVVVRSGWEWELPRHPRDFAVNSIFGNYVAALGWLAEGRVITDGLVEPAEPGDCQRVYQELLHQRAEKLSYRFDWPS